MPENVGSRILDPTRILQELLLCNACAKDETDRNFGDN